MTTNSWVEISRKIYAALLSLYPKEHRDDYATPMQQVFNEQCRNAYEQKGRFGILLLWLRTLPDLGYTALLEHVTSPRATWGLMEPVPNAPLPWKGVFLVLLPGLVYLAGQIAQLITGETWFYFVTYRVTFFLIIPPLIAWVITRRFPLWGLIPMGLFFRVTQEIGYQFIAMHPKLFSGNPILKVILNAARQVSENLWLLLIPLAITTLLLGWWYVRQKKPMRSFWVWLGVYALIVFARFGQEYPSAAQFVRYLSTYHYSEGVWEWINSFIAWTLYPYIAFLLLIFLGVFFTRRHGFFAILILVGYILPTSVMGLQDFNQYPNPTLALGIFSTVILVYRSILTLLAPIWMSRNPSQTGKKHVILISIAAALAIHAVTQFYQFMLLAPAYLTSNWIFSVALDELKLISAFLLAISIYQNALPQTNEPEPAQIRTAELTT
ncbi:MAG: hypothetical protein CVU44_12210 [Chloroflexi bacterium HGW-Chloroflexi-6]|nr:MAG: hypothetical protein CVU44_12210 [Chloroflexi bacterium HGW-Chloroflexi-6]